jgi:chemotaxis protein histidine kinase CheA
VNAYAQAQARIHALADDYVRQAARDVETCIRMLDRWRAGSPPAADELRELFDILHNVKAQGGMFGYPLITDMAEIACAILRDRATIGDADLSFLLRCTQSMQTVLERRVAGSGGDNGRKLLEKLRLLAAPPPGKPD